MITTMNEIEQRFDAIKDHKPKASKKLNELGEILASAYKINPDRADEMWQYLIELNVREDEKNAKFYIAQVFNKIKGFISAEDATDMIMMTPERVELMLLYGYEGATLYSVLGTLTLGFLKSENVNNIMVSLEYVYEKFGGVEAEVPEILKTTKTVIQVGTELLETDKEYKPIVKELLCEIENLDNEKIAAYGKVNGAIIGVLEGQNIEELLELATEFEFTQEFLDLLWLGRNDISTEELENIWLTFAENVSDNSKLPMPEEYCGEGFYSNSKMEFYVELINQNNSLLTIYFENNEGKSFKQCIFYKWIQENKWDKFAEYIAKSLMAFEGENNSRFDYGYMGMINLYMEGYLMSEDMDRTDQWGRSTKIINNGNIEKFIDTLCKASAMSVGCEYHERYHARVKEFIEETTKDMAAFKKYGFDEEIDTRNGFQRLEAFAREFLISGKKEVDFRVSSYELRSLMDKIKKENQELDIIPKDINYMLACNDVIVEFYYKHIRSESFLKGKMLAACIKHGDIERAIKITNLLKDTQKYEDYDALHGWREEFSSILEECVKEFNSEYCPLEEADITAEMIEQCIQIVNMCLDYLNEECIARVTIQIRKICPEREDNEEYLEKLLKDVEVYSTFPKPRGKGSVSNINRMSNEIMESFEILSGMDRMDIVCKIMEKFASVKDILKPVKYNTWMCNMNWKIKDENYIKIFRQSRKIYEAWMESDVREDDIKEAARKINKCGTKEEYEEFKKMVFSRCGVIDGIDEYCESYNWE